VQPITAPMAMLLREWSASTAAHSGIVPAIGGISGLFGAFLAEWLVRRFGFGRTFIGSAVVIGIATLLPLAHGSAAVWSAFLIAAQLGDLAWPVYSISERSLLQAITPNHLPGRVNSSMHLLFHGVLPSAADRRNRSATFGDLAGVLAGTPTARTPACRGRNKGMSTISRRTHAGSPKGHGLSNRLGV
jgi:hypothetical protein